MENVFSKIFLNSLLRRDSNAGVFLWISHYFEEYLRKAVFVGFSSKTVYIYISSSNSRAVLHFAWLVHERVTKKGKEYCLSLRICSFPTLVHTSSSILSSTNSCSLLKSFPSNQVAILFFKYRYQHIYFMQNVL